MVVFKNWTIALLVMLSTFVFGQDPQFSQFYAAPTYLNPAFTGATQQYRVSMNYRNQWPAIPGAFVSYNFAYDQYFPDINCGMGVMVTHDRAGSGALRYTNLAGLFSYEFRVNKSIVIRPGAQFGIYKRGVDIDKLIFADQISRGGGRSSVEFLNPVFTTKFDVSAGLLVYGTNFYGGISSHHISRPNQSLLSQEAQLPIKYSIHGGGRYVLSKGRYNEAQKAIWMAFNLKEQNEFRQLDLGAYTEFYPVVFGLWYRGIPVGKGKESYQRNTDALTVLVGTRIATLQIGYSYDLTLSRLAGNTGGAHEISLQYEFVNGRPKKRQFRVIPCPRF